MICNGGFGPNSLLTPHRAIIVALCRQSNIPTILSPYPQRQDNLIERCYVKDLRRVVRIGNTLRLGDICDRQVTRQFHFAQSIYFVLLYAVLCTYSVNNRVTSEHEYHFPPKWSLWSQYGDSGNGPARGDPIVAETPDNSKTNPPIPPIVKPCWFPGQKDDFVLRRDLPDTRKA